MVQRGSTNPLMIDLLSKIKEASIKSKSGVWKALHKNLSRPTRKRVEVNLSKLERHANAGDIILVPGVLLGSGNLTKKITVSAFRASGSAIEKIKASGSKYIPIEELIKKHPDGKKVKVLG
jgi:large subunit ribosomal protein L18e